MKMTNTIQPRLELGRLNITNGVSSVIGSSTAMMNFMRESLVRHLQGDWGTLDGHDCAVNEDALQHGGRVLSSYSYGDVKIYVITEKDPMWGPFTTVLLPEEY